VWETYLALCMLRGPVSRARRVGLDPLKSSRVQECLAWQPQVEADVRRARMRAALRELAIKGFSPIPARNDEVAEVGVLMDAAQSVILRRPRPSEQQRRLRIH
jgi:hypothetical protein